MPQEKDVRIEHKQGLLLPVAGVYAGVHRARNPGVRATVEMDKSEIQINSYEIRTKFVQTSYEFMRIHVYG